MTLYSVRVWLDDQGKPALEASILVKSTDQGKALDKAISQFYRGLVMKVKAEVQD